MDFIKDIHNPKNYRNISIQGAHWSMEYGGQLDIIYQSEEIDLELRKLIFGIWDYIKNSGKYPESKNYVLKRIFSKSGARESRRFVGDYVLTENDIENKINFEDAVCIGGWPMDIHAPLGIYDSIPATNFVPVTGNYNIPMRSLYTKDIDNLMLAGRNISASHIALGSTRVMATCGAMGQAVGTTASYCVAYGLTPREVTKSYSKELQRTLLNDDQTILGLQDIDHKMQNFTASATSEKKFENIECSGWMKLDRDYGLAFMLETDFLESVKIKITNRSNDTETLRYRLFTGVHIETFLPDTVIGNKEVTIPGNYDGWIKIDINANKGRDGKLYLVFTENENLAFGISSSRPIGAITLRMHTTENSEGCNHDSVPLNKNTGYLFFDHRYERSNNILFKELVPEQRVFSPAMVLSSYTRPYGMPNLWIGEKNFPQTLTLTADKPVDANKVAIIFDSYLENDRIQKLPDCLVRDYDLTIYCRDQIIQKSMRDNWKRYEVFDIPTVQVEKIEITIKNSWGAEAGIYGVNLFCEESFR
jgi:hypothetical protein